MNKNIKDGNIVFSYRLQVIFIYWGQIRSA